MKRAFDVAGWVGFFAFLACLCWSAVELLLWLFDLGRDRLQFAVAGTAVFLTVALGLWSLGGDDENSSNLRGGR